METGDCLNGKAERVMRSRIMRLFPRTVGGRMLLGLSLSLLALLLALGVIVGSMWIESRYPSDDANRALLPGAQAAITKPVVHALGRQVERAMQRRAERRYMSSELTWEETIARFGDERVDWAQRRILAYRLAKVGSPEAVAILLKVLHSAPPEHKAFMAQLIGSTGNPTAKQWLLPLLSDGDAGVVKATIRGLSVIADGEVITRIAEILSDGQRAETVRIEAAQGLGTIGTPAARDALAATFGKVPEEEVATQILNSLGKFPYASVAELFRQYLEAPETPAEMRIAAVEALAHSSPDATPYLFGLAGEDTDADVRASAAWAISIHNSVASFGPGLTDLIERETDEDVRRRLYEALLPQSGIPGERLLPKVRAEEDIEARVAGFNALGRAVRQQPASTVAVAFDTEIVPELVRIATGPNSVNVQMRAVFALRRAQTPAAQSALAEIATKARPQIATAARNGLRTSSS
jgi:HEAT repeat protein